MNERFNKFKKIISEYIVYIVISIIAFIALIVWRSDPNCGSISDLGLNAFTELLGMLITIGIVENIIKKQNNKNMLPLKAAMYRDVQKFLSSVIIFWGEIYNDSVPGENPKTVNQLLSEESFNNMLKYLNLNSHPICSPLPEMTWYEWIVIKGNRLYENGEKVLNRYQSNINPEVFRHIHFLVDDSSFILGMKEIMNCRNFDIQNQTPRPQNLDAYYAIPSGRTAPEYPFPKKEILNALSELFYWCDKTYDELKKSGHPASKVELYYHNENNSDFPPCMMSEEVRLNQISYYRFWQSQNRDNVS